MIGRLMRFPFRLALLVMGTLFVVFGRSSGEGSTRESSGVEPESWLWSEAKRWAFRALVVLTVLGMGGLVVLVSGIVPIKASSGHWAITAWFLDFAKMRSVSTHTLGMEAPELDELRLVVKGAGHYEFACLPCHGSPSLAQPRVARQMMPTPPDLRESVPQLDPDELFYIVKHGIKFTGMPAWPARQRDDEVWAMVAFLRKLPGMDPQEYQRLATGAAPESRRVPMEDLVPSTGVPEAIVASCSRCHGLDGRGRGAGAFPVLAGQGPQYLRASLEAYAKGERHSGLMEPVAAALGLDDMQAVADHYAARGAAAAPNDARDVEGDVTRGRQIAHEGLPDKLVPACITCHGPGETRRNPHYPRLAGQYADYIHLQLTLFKSRTRGGTPYHHIMERVANQLTDDEMRAVAAFFASLPADPEIRR